MRIYSLQEDEKASYADILPEGIGAEDALCHVEAGLSVCGRELSSQGCGKGTHGLWQLFGADDGKETFICGNPFGG